MMQAEIAETILDAMMQEFRHGLDEWLWTVGKKIVLKHLSGKYEGYKRQKTM